MNDEVQNELENSPEGDEQFPQNVPQQPAGETSENEEVASEEEVHETPEDVTLDIHSSTIGQHATNAGGDE